MPDETMNMVETTETSSFGIGKFILGLFVLTGAVVCTFAFGPKYLPKKKEQEYTTVENGPAPEATGTTQTDENN